MGTEDLTQLAEIDSRGLPMNDGSDTHALREAVAVDAAHPPPPVERRKMLGMRTWFVGGNMLAFVVGQAIVVGLPGAERKKLVRAGGAPLAVA